MARFQLVSIAIIMPLDSSLLPGDHIHIYWNDVTEEIEVRHNVQEYDEPGVTLGQLDVHYRILAGITSSERDYSVCGYSFCDDVNLIWFRILKSYPVFPFIIMGQVKNSPVCTNEGPVCDIHWVGSPEIVHATSQTQGGSVRLLAESSNGVVRYGNDRAIGGRPPEFDDFTNTTGIFTNLTPGSWHFQAKDENDCTVGVFIVILYKPQDFEHYRFTWASKQIGKGTSRDARIRIYEREYIGDVVEVDYADVSPFTLNKPKQGDINDKFFPIHPTNATLRLKSLQDYQFLPLFTQDNKRYRVAYEVDEGSGFTPIWTGFVVPSVYREDFIATPYTVEIQISDNVKTLEDEPFTDDNGNLLSGNIKLIKVISQIMKKTGLTLKIRSGINIFEVNHNKAESDDPLDQTYVDLACYRDGIEPFSCWQVLEAILRPFGARIYQYDGQWIIEEIDRCVEQYPYRVFTADGDYESNGTFDPIIQIKSPYLTDRAALIERDHSMEVVPAYGKITLNSQLNYVGSIVTGGFEKEDLLSPENEEFVGGQGVYSSEEGFRDWTLRLNGTSGVSFGRVVVGDNPTGVSRRGIQEDDLTRSVGAFFYTHGSWNGNLREAYIESSEKPYQYGPGDNIRFAFEYSTPAKPEYEFMVLRMMIKVGSNYLQPDLTWGATQSIYRAYPKISNSLQSFEITVPAPATTEVVDSTIQVRIYYYAPAFFDFGLPTPSTDPDEGTDGTTSLKELPTAGINYDYRVDARLSFTIGSTDSLSRAFYEMRVSNAAEDVIGGIVHPNDHGASNNRIWYRLKLVNIMPDETNDRLRGLDVKFYLDNVVLDALVNGQPPPSQDTIELNVSKYINETLELELYNFDVPTITNAKNMYNNYFKLSTGAPTTTWSRTGIAENRPLQQILLKVLGGNHSAPTFRLTGSFINEFQRIGINNYIRLTKPGSTVAMANTEFTSDISGWTMFGAFVNPSWVWSSINDGSAQVTMSTQEDSKQIYQDVSHIGGYIKFTVNISVVPSAESDREDSLWVLFYRNDSIIHAERLRTFAGTSGLYEFTYIAFCPGSVDRIGFIMQSVAGAGTCVYRVGQFKPEGVDIHEVYQIADYRSEERLNTYFFELMQISKTYVSLAAIDTGGNNQGGDTTGREHSSAYSSAYS